MTLAEIREIDNKASEAILKIIDVYDELPEYLRNDDTFEYFYHCINKTLTLDLFNWKRQEL